MIMLLKSACILLLGSSVVAAQSAPQPGIASPASPPSAPSADATPGGEADDRGWPRRFEVDGDEVLVHQPQVLEWPGFDRIQFLAAVSIGRADSDARIVGTVRVSADTKVAKSERLVVLTNRTIEEATFPGVEPAGVDLLVSTIRTTVQLDRPQTISLDRLIASLDPTKVPIAKTDVNLDPPTILWSERPAVLVIFLGKPRFKPVPGPPSGAELLFAVNTNWDLFLDPSEQRYYLLDERSWLTTADLERGPWTPASTLPKSLSSLPADDNWSDVQAAIPGEPFTVAPTVHVSHDAAELIVTEGEPEFEPITGSRLMRVANTESVVLYDAPERTYYVLAAGRWFASESSLAGPWRSASGSLPQAFREIPESDEHTELLASVPGTAAANDAAILASIPEKATIQRADVSLTVRYDGPPDFRPISGTTVEYAHNSPYDVFRVDGTYYCCSNAVWFVAPTPTGAWTVCDAVPKAIYTIPPTSPKHNVTYVTVYESTPTTVVTGYTSGYSGETVAATGVVMFGLGLAIGAAIDDDDCCWSYHYRSCSFSYGCGAVWSSGNGGYVCATHTYGPYGGAGRVAAYNPNTGVYSRGAYAYGPNGAAGVRSAYNPSTGVSAGRAGAVTPYGSWGRSAATNGDEWVRAGHRTTAQGTVGAVQGSEGGAAATAQGRYGNGVSVAKTKDGDYYASKNGNVYKKGSDGWEEVRNAPSGGSSTRPATESRPAPRETTPELQQQAQSRDRGERTAQRAQESRRSPSTSRPANRGGRRR
jgi:hypothetical protein